MSNNRTAVLALALLALGAVSVGTWFFRGRPGPVPDCPPGQIRLDEEGVATCRAGAQPSAAQKITAGAKLALNTSSAADLAAIDGVGPALAQAIVDARAKAGRFQSWDEVDAVPGVGPVRLEALKAFTALDAHEK